MTETKFLLPESAIPERWYNIQADMPNPAQPVLHPGTGQPVGPDDLAPLFPMELILQEVSSDAEIPIPEPIRDVYRLWRPTPLYRAHRLERELGTRSRISSSRCHGSSLRKRRAVSKVAPPHISREKSWACRTA